MSEESVYPKIRVEKYGTELRIKADGDGDKPIKLMLAIQRVVDGFIRATTKHPTPFHTTHEGYAVIAEELDEVWDSVRANQTPLAVTEAIEVAAMGLRFAVDLGE